MELLVNVMAIMVIPIIIAYSFRPRRHCDKCRIDMWLGELKK